MTDDWLQSLDESIRNRAERLIRMMTALGAPDAARWVRSEIEEDIPQVARFLALRQLWPNIIDAFGGDDSWIEQYIAMAERRPEGSFADAGQALRKMVDAGVSSADIRSLARFVAYQAVFTTLSLIDEGYDPDLDEDEAPGWMLVETDVDGTATGRHVGGLHQSLLSLDPTGREGRPE